MITTLLLLAFFTLANGSPIGLVDTPADILIKMTETSKTMHLLTIAFMKEFDLQVQVEMSSSTPAQVKQSVEKYEQLLLSSLDQVKSIDAQVNSAMFWLETMIKYSDHDEQLLKSVKESLDQTNDRLKLVKRFWNWCTLRLRTSPDFSNATDRQDVLINMKHFARMEGNVRVTDELLNEAVANMAEYVKKSSQ